MIAGKEVGCDPKTWKWGTEQRIKQTGVKVWSKPHPPWVYITAKVESRGQNGVLSSPSDQRLELVRPMKSAATLKENGGADAGRTLVNKAGSVVSGRMDWWVASTGKRRSQKVKWSQRKQSHRRL